MKKIRGWMAVLLVAMMVLGAVPAMASQPKLMSLTVTPVATPWDTMTAPAQHFTVHNPNAVEVTVNWETISKGSGQLQLGGGETTTLTIADASLAGFAVALTPSAAGYAQGTAVVANSFCGYEVRIQYVDYEGGGVLHTEYATVRQTASVQHTAVSTRTFNSLPYRLSSEATKTAMFIPYGQSAPQQQTLTFTYREVKPEPYSVDVKYVNKANNMVVDTKSVMIAVNGSATIAGVASFTKDNVTYEIDAASAGTTTHNYDMGKKEYVIFYNAVAPNPDSPYTVRVTYVVNHAAGTELHAYTVTVPVNGQVEINAPATYTKGDGYQYALRSGQASSVTHKANNSKRTYTFVYELSGTPTQDYTIEVVYVDPQQATVLEKHTVTVPLNGAATFDCALTLSVNGTDYIIVGESARQINHTFGNTKRVYYVYYNTLDNPAEPYDITVYYMDNETNSVFRTATYTLPVGQQLTIPTPETMVYEGTEYALGINQSNMIATYSSGRTAYYVFYKLVGETDEENTPIPENDDQGGLQVTNEEYSANISAAVDGPEIPGAPSMQSPNIALLQMTGNDAGMGAMVAWLAAGIALASGLLLMIIAKRRKKETQANQ